MQLMHHPFLMHPEGRRFAPRQMEIARPFSACSYNQIPRGFSPFRPNDLDIKTLPIRVEIAQNRPRGAAPPRPPSSHIQSHENRFFRENIIPFQPRSQYSKDYGFRCESMDFMPRYNALPKQIAFQRHFSALPRQPYNPEYYGQMPIPGNKYVRQPANVTRASPIPPSSYKVIHQKPKSTQKYGGLQTSIIDQLYDKSNSKPGIKPKLDVKMTQSIIQPKYRHR